MSPLRRLLLCGTGAIVGSALLVAGSRVTWETLVVAGPAVQTPAGTVRFPEERIVRRAADMGGDAVGAIAVLALLASVLWFLAGPRARFALVALVAVLAPLPRALTWTEPVLVVPVASGRIENGPAPELLAVGGALALIAALVALPLAARVRALRMPERSADEASAS